MNNETNTPRTNSKLSRYIKSGTLRIVLAAGLVLVGSLATYALADPLAELYELEDQYTEKLTKKMQAAEYYNLANKNWCETRMLLASKKLELYHSKDLELDQKEFVRISNLVEAGCEPSEEVFLPN
jgi:hypothetical protein